LFGAEEKEEQFLWGFLGLLAANSPGYTIVRQVVATRRIIKLPMATRGISVASSLHPQAYTVF
jgi:hypothetical protein